MFSPYIELTAVDEDSPDGCPHALLLDVELAEEKFFCGGVLLIHPYKGPCNVKVVIDEDREQDWSLVVLLDDLCYGMNKGVEVKVVK